MASPTRIWPNLRAQRPELQPVVVSTLLSLKPTEQGVLLSEGIPDPSEFRAGFPLTT